MKKINLLIIATNRYCTNFLADFLKSAEQFFLPEYEVNYCVFTDRTVEAGMKVSGGSYKKKVSIYPIEHKPWPHATLKRFHFFLEHKYNMPDADYLYYCDVDSRFVAPIGEEILGDLTAVQHCGYLDGQNLPFEDNKASIAYVQPSDRKQYFGGGFFGGNAGSFWALASKAAEMIGVDESNGIIPVWHDESIINRIFIDYPPTVILSPSYHWPEKNPHIWNKWTKQGLNFECKILLLDKNHAEIRK